MISAKSTNFILAGFLTCLFIGCDYQSQPRPEFGGEYRAFYNAREDLSMIDRKGKYVLYGAILDYARDEEFILIAERPRDQVYECSGKGVFTTRECDKAFEKSSYIQYWIIDKSQEEAIYGPYQKEEYLQKRRKLNIAESLQLKKY